MLVLKSLVVLRDEKQLFAPLTASLSAGHIYQVIGPNGRGKTTLLRTMTGIYTQYTGQYFWENDIVPVYLGHKLGLNLHLTLYENVIQLLSVYGLSLSCLDRLLLDLGLMGLEDATTSKLSAGQTRKIALAPLFHPDMAARAWLLDEPFTSLDKQTCLFLEKHLQQYVENGGLVMMTSHQEIVSSHLRNLVKTIELQEASEVMEGL